jgi:hypothetical protein
MLTSDEKNTLSDLVISHMKYQSVIGEFEFKKRYDECTDEQIDALNAVCEDPSGKFLDIPGGWISAWYSVADDSYEIFGMYQM